MNNFTKVGSDNKCFSTFIPPYVLDNMAKAGIEEAKSTILQSQYFREKRTETSKKMGMEAGLPKAVVPVGRAYVQVYDSENTTTFQKTLKRDQGGNSSPTGIESVDLTYDYVSKDRDFLKEKVINRNSLDNNGMDLICNVHFGVKYNNAFWDGEQITLGDGDGIIFTNFSKSLDVIAHELGHGVVQFTADFEYHGQSGALNEHFADVFGTVITQWVENQTSDKADWLIGDEIMGPELYGEALRSMSEPGTAYDNSILGKDPQPAHMKDIYTGTGDNGGVHINSGIMNKAFYLTAIEIGTDQAALIWYNALQNLWPTAIFKEAVGEIVKAARILAKNNKVDKDATQRVRTAFREVGLF
ncbi:M4 family metallopeptidase [Methanosarcina acetivorans]|nr:M4 family metallopeptidase [Methanosarcina acetivorans]